MNQNTIRVLIADDSDDDRTLLARAIRALPGFKLCGMTVNGVEAVAWLNGTPPYSNRERYPFPDLLLLDYQMPGYSGLEVLQWVHEQVRRPAVVLWSDSPRLIDQTKAHRFGAKVVCAKPRGSSDLREILSRIFPRLAVPSAPAAPPPVVQPRKI